MDLGRIDISGFHITNSCIWGRISAGVKNISRSVVKSEKLQLNSILTMPIFIETLGLSKTVGETRDLGGPRERFHFALPSSVK
jgi:hypothetical protein